MYFIQFSVLLVFAFATLISGQQIESEFACENMTLSLDCMRRHLIKIVSANYGRTSSNVCQFYTEGNCRSSTSLNIMKQKCDLKPSCTVMAHNNIFGDTCYGVIKYLDVKFKCVPAPECRNTHFQCDDGTCIIKKFICDGKNDCSEGEDERGCKYMTAYGCETENLNIECKRGELIRVLYGHYGRTNPRMCRREQNVNCHSPSAYFIIHASCNMKNKCSIPITNEIFGDPCSGVLKYAEVKYICWPNPL